MKKIFYIIIGIGLWFLVNTVIMNCYPKLICCSDGVNLQNYTVYMCDQSAKLPTMSETADMIKAAEFVIQKSEIFNPKTVFEIYIKNDKKECLFNSRTAANAKGLAYYKHKFFAEENFGVNNTINGTTSFQYDRPLSSIMAHQFSHTMIVDKFGWIKTRLLTLFDKHSRTKQGMLWKEEGYADYIAQDGLTTPNLTEVDFDKLDYYKARVAVKYLIDIKHLNIKQILAKDLELDKVYEEAVSDGA